MTQNILRHCRPLAVVAASLVSIGQAIAGVPDTQRNFVECPILLDTEPVPCWVADYKGERYFLAVQSGRGAGGTTIPPQLLHRALVEGTMSDEPRICGGIVLRPIMISPMMDEIDQSCNRLEPSGGYHANGPRVVGLDGDPPGERESTAFGESFGQRTGLDERRAVYVANAAARKRMDFEIGFFFDSDYIIYPIEQEDVEDAVDYANLLKASKIEIVAYSAPAQLSDGGERRESADIAKRRAEKLALILKDFGWSADRLSVKWEAKPTHNGGVRDYERRKAVIRVMP